MFILGHLPQWPLSISLLIDEPATGCRVAPQRDLQGNQHWSTKSPESA
ncbi:hypothetical protein D1BOALGB6SA_8073 [Olavius sp. associated proteobacterium Delta 1]|nr:hypothetical protein D1BOALGB6SA_8073 [Olavius sp. associated proteobacterium Delta 1]